MKKRIKTLVWTMLAVIMLLFGTLQAFGCEKKQEDLPFSEPEVEGSAFGIFENEDFLRADGAKLKNDFGLGEEVVLKGINAGGYLVLERWMTAMDAPDHKSLTEQLVQNFGSEKTLRLLKYYRDQFWTDEDFSNCAEMGMNVIRLPFTYMSVDPEFNNINKIEGQKYNFVLLDNFIKRAAKFGIYTMLDLHGAYGSQNGEHHSGEIISKIEDVDFYSNEENIAKTIDLWQAIAERYKDNPAVCGYDILNEPIEKAQGTTTKRHWDFFDRVYKAIREIDDKHLIIFESCWGGGDLPMPSEYGWENCMYSFHHYTSTSNYSTHMKSMVERVQEVSSRNFGVPIHMGEFSCYNNEDSWRETLSLFNARGWHWTSWSYKINRLDDSSYAGWGVYYTKAERVILVESANNPHKDTYENIVAKWSKIKTIDKFPTDSELEQYPFLPRRPLQAFESGVTLFDIIKQQNTLIN